MSENNRYEREEERELAAFGRLIGELEQEGNRPYAPPPEVAFRRELRRELLAEYERPGLSRRALRNLWQFAVAAVAVLLLLGAGVYFALMLGNRPGAAGPPAAERVVTPRVTEAPVEVDDAAVAPAGEEEVTGTDRVWLVSLVQKGRETADSAIEFEVRLGYELVTYEEAELKVLYAHPEWQRSTGRVPMDSMGDVIPVSRGSDIVTFHFSRNPAEMREIVGTERPVLHVQLTYIADEGEFVELEMVASPTFAEYPLDLSSTEAVVYVPAGEEAVAAACMVTEPVWDQPPDDPNADPFGEGLWYINEERTMWIGLGPTGAWRTGGEKVIWIRPAGEDLQVSGQRLDAEAPPLHAGNPCCYPTGFQVGGLTFPTEGCWEVMATAGEHTLSFVTWVLPYEDPPAPRASCDSLEDAVRQSEAIIVGEVTGTEGNEHYSWQNVAVLQTWKSPPGTSGIGDRIYLLQELAAEPALEVGSQYVLFLQHPLWQITCPQETLFELVDGEIVARGERPVWPGGSYSDLVDAVETLK